MSANLDDILFYGSAERYTSEDDKPMWKYIAGGYTGVLIICGTECDQGTHQGVCDGALDEDFFDYLPDTRRRGTSPFTARCRAISRRRHL